MLKSTPPAWAGTDEADRRDIEIKLKSTPPAWAGTAQGCDPIGGGKA